jgi:pimeloyl-ACP methyl ester carboxylesterase
VAAAAVLLVACGGSDDPDRGSLIEPAATMVTLTAAQIDATTASSGMQPLVGKAKCDVKVVSLNYATAGARSGEVSNASGVLLVPTGAACTQPVPLVAHARGTNVLKTHTLANPQESETFLLAAMFAAQGYAVVATDYLGYAKSSYGFHPYLHADSAATTVIDSVRAARNAAGAVSANLSGKVMFTGYSQGGHASMAAQRAAERDYGNEFNVVAGAHLAGPYNLSGSLRSPQPAAASQLFAPFMLTSFQKVYGNVYSDVKAVFKAPYSGYIETLMPNATMGNSALLSSGLLPGGTTSAALDALFQPGYLESVRTSDSQPFYVAAKKNDLLGWTPKAKVLLCGGSGDPTVPPAIHQNVMKADFDRRGVTNVVSVDVDPLVRATYGVNGAAPTDPASAAFATYYGNYHGAYEPPLCLAQAKGWFDTVK